MADHISSSKHYFDALTGGVGGGGVRGLAGLLMRLDDEQSSCEIATTALDTFKCVSIYNNLIVNGFSCLESRPSRWQ